MLPNSPQHLPHVTHPQVLAMGMRPMSGPWLEPSGDLASWVAHKCERRGVLGSAVYQVLPDGLPGATELARRVFDHVRKPASVLSTMPEQEWLWQASLLSAEDLVIMAPVNGEYRLVAASLCSPSHWRLPDKIGRPMARIHDPIPAIHDTLSAKIERVFQHLRVDHPVERYNWSVQEDAQLFCWPLDSAQPLTPETPLFYRVERQTLSRLPQSGALAFTIRVHLDPLSDLQHSPGALAALFDAMAANPHAIQRYKNFDVLEPALEKYRALV